MNPRERLWETSPGQLLTATKALSMLRRSILLLGHKNANTCTWKSVRSGRATEMSASGITPGQVLEVGQWRSAANFQFFDGTSAGNLQLLRTALDESDDE